jgi:hypothetical protein
MQRFAVFIDADNVPPTVIEKIYEIINERGKIVLVKVFGDFSQPRLLPWKKTCIRYNLDAIIAWHKSGKNTSDLKLCQACVHTMYRRNNIQQYVLVTGDGDFTTVVQDLKAHEKHVICMGMTASTSNVLTTCCDEFISLDSVTTREAVGTPTVQEAVGISTVQEAVGISTVQEAVDISTTTDERTTLIRLTIERIFNEGEEELNCGALSDRLLRINPQFTKDNFNQPTFRRLLEHLGYIVFEKHFGSGGTPFCKKQ